MPNNTSCLCRYGCDLCLSEKEMRKREELNEETSQRYWEKKRQQNDNKKDL